MVKHGGAHVKICAGIEGGGKVGHFVKTTPTINKNSYHSIVVHHAVPSGFTNIVQGFTFEQDNDPKLMPKLCLNYLKTKQTQKALKIMIWPPQSPDLNPIEKMWDELDRKVRKIVLKNVQSLWKCLEDAWKNLTVKRWKSWYLECQIYVRLSLMLKEVMLMNAKYELKSFIYVVVLIK